MKKVYVKPGIELESFAMSANIAGDCSKKMTAAELELEKQEWGVFNEAENCSNREWYSCYHVPIDGLGVFTS